MKYTDEQIKQAFELCYEGSYGDEACKKCPLQNDIKTCDNLHKHIFDLINRKEAEIESLKRAYLDYEETSGLKWARAEAIKEFAERLKDLIYPQLGISTYEKGEAFHFCLGEIDNLVKEMVGESNG